MKQKSPQSHAARYLGDVLVSVTAALVTGLVTFALLSGFASFRVSLAAPADPPTESELAVMPPVAAPMLPEPVPQIVTEGVLAKGDSLGRSLAKQGVAAATVHEVSRAMAPHFDFRRAQPGHSYELVQNAAGQPLAFTYRTSPIEIYEVSIRGEEYEVRKRTVNLVAHVARVEGTVASTLYRAVVDLGVEAQVASDFTEVFAWDLDFSRSVHPGDQFKILYERLYREEPDGREIYVRPGKILAARYWGVSGAHEAIYFESEEGRGGYYRPDGSSVERDFLIAPLRYSRISSSYNPARRHPILKVTRPHYGIDYAAPSGTPVWSVADGEVIYRGWAGGFGNLVKIRHGEGYVSYYAHLSRFGRGLRVGQKVQQKQLIGYVGQTGLATGPHVCFRMTLNDRYVDPQRLQRPTGDPILDSLRPVFLAASNNRLAELDVGPLVATDEAL